jgi:hypothetical protein
MTAGSLAPSMIEALTNLADGEQKHGAHVLPGRSGHHRITPLRALRDRGLIKQIRQPHSWSGAADVEWRITEEGRIALALVTKVT